MPSPDSTLEPLKLLPILFLLVGLTVIPVACQPAEPPAPVTMEVPVTVEVTKEVEMLKACSASIVTLRKLFMAMAIHMTPYWKARPKANVPTATISRPRSGWLHRRILYMARI